MSQNETMNPEGGMDTMNLRDEAMKRCVPMIGSPYRRHDLEPNHLYEIYMDEYDNEFIIRRGILTIVSGDGRVY